MDKTFVTKPDLYFHAPGSDLYLDVTRIHWEASFFEQIAPDVDRALSEMAALERGAIANPDEKRMVGHYWLRSPVRAPRPDLRAAIERAAADVKAFAAKVHSGEVKPETEAQFRQVLVIGIGGSALGPELVSDALAGKQDKMRVSFFDNTDPDGMDRVIDAIGTFGKGLSETLVVVISKSGGTKETRNGMLEARSAFERAGLAFGKHAVAVTGEGSELDKYAANEGFLARFPMWDWVGGRTSELSAVGLLPAALQGIDVDALLAGAADMDELTRARQMAQNPAMMLALAWHSATGGVGRKDMVLLPYKDRLLLFSRYLQQLVMESLGKWLDLEGNEVGQGIAVYGNKGSTDQHAYVQQLRDGLDNFFVTFIEVLKDREDGRSDMEVEPGVTSGDYLSGFLQGTRKALWDRGRESITITVPDMSARTMGMLIALYERAVGFYASLVHINAYHQPGVEAGKKAAGDVLALQAKIIGVLRANPGNEMTLEQIAKEAKGDSETVFAILRHLSANPGRGVEKRIPEGRTVFSAVYKGTST